MTTTPGDGIRIQSSYNFQQQNTRRTNKLEAVTIHGEKKQSVETVPKESQMLGAIDKDIN